MPNPRFTIHIREEDPMSIAAEYLNDGVYTADIRIGGMLIDGEAVGGTGITFFTHDPNELAYHLQELAYRLWEEAGETEDEDEESEPDEPAEREDPHPDFHDSNHFDINTERP